MHPLSILDEARLEAVVREFVAHLAAKRMHEARALTAPGFEWFGRQVAETDWRGSALASFVGKAPLEVARCRLLPPLSMLPLGAFGVLSSGERVLLVDLRRDGKETTVFVVISEDLRVRRVGDPAAFVEAMMGTGGGLS